MCRTCSDTGGAGVLNAAGVFAPTGAGGPIISLGLLPVLTGSSSLIVSGGLSACAAAVRASSPAAAAAVPALAAALGAAGVLQLLWSA